MGNVIPKINSLDDILYITPKDQSYDYIINTDSISPEQAAEAVLKFIEN